MLDRWALLGGTVWQRVGAVRWAEVVVAVAVVQPYVTAQERTILRVGEVTLPLSSGVSLLSMVALQGGGSLYWARGARPAILYRWVLDLLSRLDATFAWSGFDWLEGPDVMVHGDLFVTLKNGQTSGHRKRHGVPYEEGTSQLFLKRIRRKQ